MNTVRLVLLRVEESGPDGWEPDDPAELYHLVILIEAGLVEGAVAIGERGYPAGAHATRLTWAGHEFLDAARSDTLWRKALSLAKDGVALPVLQDVLKQLALRAAGLSQS